MRPRVGTKVITNALRFRVGRSLACGLIVTSTALGNSPLFHGKQYEAGDEPRSVAISDLNGDNVPDLAVANNGTYPKYDGKVSVLLGVGDGTFSATVDYAAGGRPTSVAIGDLDGDSVPDLVVANHHDDNVSVLLGLGDGTFAAAVHYVASDGPHSVAIGDLDGDQVPDLAVAGSGTYPEYDGNVAVLLGVGDGTFSAAAHYAAGNSPTSVAIGDLDGDHVPDLAVTSSGTAYEYAGSVSVLLGVGDGTFAAAVHYAVGIWARSVVIGDLDGDQVPDLAVANRGVSEDQGDVSVLLGVGDGTFAAPVNYLARSHVMSLAIGDLDGDEVPDLAVADYYADNVSVLLGLGDGTFAARRDYAAGDRPSFLAIGDLDGDLVPDLALANCGSNNVSVLLGVGDGTPVAAVQYGVGDGPTSAAIGDLNGDQVPDLTASNRFSNNVSVLLGVGDGTFVTAVNYAVGESPSFIAIGDLDGDEVLDLAVANRRYGENHGTVSVLLGVGDGTFAAAVNYAVYRGPKSVAIGDLDGDRVPDLAVACGWKYPEHDGNVSVLFGVGDGTFAAAVDHAVGDSLHSVAIGDLDGDEVPDLAVASHGADPEVDGSASVLLGVGDGTFAAAVRYRAAIGARSVAIGDLDGDDVPDVAVASSGDLPNNKAGFVSVLLGVGDGTLVAAVNYAAGDYARSLVIGDLDGDDVPDVAVARKFRSNVSVLRGVGDGVFAAEEEYLAGNWTNAVAIGDLDGDRKPDLAVANFSSASVSVLLNQSGDCNGNDIPDECDIDCGASGGPCDLPCCGICLDCNDNGVPDECDADSDADGFPNDCDLCLDSDLAKLIVLNECPTGVTNALLNDGCTMNDVLSECSVGAHSHGELTACVARHANEWRRQGLLSGKDVGRITQCAGTSIDHRPSKRVKDVITRGRR